MKITIAKDTGPMKWLPRISPIEAITRKDVHKKGDLLDFVTQDVRVAEAVTSINGSADLRWF